MSSVTATTVPPPRPARRRIGLADTILLAERRAWAAFALVAMLLVATVPLAAPASAQLPDLPLPGGTGDEEEDPDEGDPGEGDPGEGDPDEGDPDDGAGGGGDADEGGPPGAPLPGGSGDPASPAAGPRTAYYTAPTSDALPNTLISEFPPGVVCILIPEFCTESATQITGPIQGGLLGGVEAVDEGTTGAQQPVMPGELPVGILGGSQRYTSALGLELPPVGEGQSFGELLITLQMTDTAFALESPVFREMVNAVLVQATPNAGPEAFEELIGAIAAGEVAPFTTEFPGLEMCVIKTPWEAGDNQPRSAQPEIDPLFCSPVAKPAEDGTVTFDMTFAANDSLPGGFVPGWEGVLVRPLAAPNVAYGDPDFTTNYVAYLANPAEAPPALQAQVVDGPPPAPPISEGTPTTGSGGGAGSPSRPATGSGSSGSGGAGSSGAGRSPAAGGSSPAASTSGAAPVATTGDEPAIDATTGHDDALAAGLPADDQGPTTPTAADVASSAWIPWVLLPMLLGGSLWYGQVLGTGPADAVVRSGGMTRLLRQRGFPV